MFFKKLAACAAMALVLASAPAAAEKQNTNRPETLMCPTRELQGRAVGDLYADYVGYKGVVPARLSIDFNAQMKALWKRKLDGRRHAPTAVARQMAKQAIGEYDVRRATHMTLQDYIWHADEETKLMRTRINWNDLAVIYRLDAERTALLKRLAETIDGRGLIAYAMTELLPGKYDGALNRSFFDFLLRNGGREYVELLPAVYDSWTSFGPYQFTSLAVYDAGGHRRGASMPNQALPERYRIPGSVMKLRGDLHFRAAMLFALDNLAHLVRKVNAKELRTLERIGPRNGELVMEYIAIAHHAPGRAPSIARRWLDHGGKYPLRVSAGRGSLVYIIKTETNYKALQ